MIAEINTKALKANAEFLRKRAGQLCAVVKADGYGHGIEVVRYLDSVADLFAVATVDEAVAARKLTEKPILLLTGEEYARYLLRNPVIDGVIPTASTMQELRVFVRRGAKFSFEVETGMNRTGSNAAELRRMFEFCYLSDITPQTCFTHFFNPPQSAEEQFLRFTAALKPFTDFKFLRHVCATNVLGLGKKYGLDFSRCGIGLYGYGDKKLTPVMSVYAPIIAIRRARTGDYVGYGTNQLSSDAIIATVRAGYADGFLRSSSPRTVEVNGCECAVLGQCCMDLTMVDVTSVAAHIGDAVYFISKRLTAEKVAKVYNTIPYEVLTNVKRTTRRYV